jgi:short-subunit dehydrogenase
MSKVAAIIGVGEGLGYSLAKKFAKEGFTVAMLSRNADSLKQFVTTINNSGGKSFAVSADATSESSLKEAFTKIKNEHGPPSVCIYNAGSFAMKSILDTSVEEFENSIKVLCTGCFITAKLVIPDMLQQKEGTFLITGATASLRGYVFVT